MFVIGVKHKRLYATDARLEYVSIDIASGYPYLGHLNHAMIYSTIEEAIEYYDDMKKYIIGEFGRYNKSELDLSTLGIYEVQVNKVEDLPLN